MFASQDHTCLFNWASGWETKAVKYGTAPASTTDCANYVECFQIYPKAVAEILFKDN